MKRLKKAFYWFVLLSKRLLKKPVFIIILALIPLLVLALNIVARQDSGVISVALAQENKNDGLSSEIINELLTQDSLIRYVNCDIDESEKMLQSGKVDSVWIFSDDLQKKADKLVNNLTQRNYMVRIVEREQTVPLLLAHEKLYGTLFKYCSESLYLNFAKTNVAQLEYKTDEQLMKYYNEVHSNDGLFEYNHIDSNESAQSITETNYLVTPIRGIFSVLIILCGLAMAMLFSKDVSKGVFSWMPYRSQTFMAAVYHFIPIIIISFVSLISLFVIGVSVASLREVLLTLLYAICCTVFCMIFRLLCVNLKILGAVTPIIVIALIAVCPVFYDFEALRAIQIIFPPFYYLKAVYNDSYLIYMIIYSVASACVYFLLRKITKKA